MTDITAPPPPRAQETARETALRIARKLNPLIRDDSGMVVILTEAFAETRRAAMEEAAKIAETFAVLSPDEAFRHKRPDECRETDERNETVRRIAAAIRTAEFDETEEMSHDIRGASHEVVPEACDCLGDPRADIDAYSRWTRTTWLSHDADGRDDERILSLIGLGLAGEMGEAIDAIVDMHERVDGYLHADVAVSELGDWLYYWARLLGAVGVSPSDVFARGVDIVPHVGVEGCLIDLAVRTNRVVERMKKRVRDGRALDDEEFRDLVARAHAAWRRACHLVGSSQDEAMAGSVDKLESRRGRGVLRGSGGDR